MANHYTICLIQLALSDLLSGRCDDDDSRGERKSKTEEAVDAERQKGEGERGREDE